MVEAVDIQKRLSDLLTGKKKLLQPGANNVKLKKNIVKSFILNLSPYKQNNKGRNLCAKASPGCIASCLYTAGFGKFTSVQQSRQLNTEVFLKHTDVFLGLLQQELIKLNEKAGKENTQYAVRLNGTSDMDWLLLFHKKLNWYPTALKNIILYDYTKHVDRMFYYQGTNYHLTFSKSENNWSDCVRVLDAGMNVAVVFKQLPTTYMGYRVEDGDLSDDRYFDSTGVIIGLRPKGRAKKDTTGFVVNVSPFHYDQVQASKPNPVEFELSTTY